MGCNNPLVISRTRSAGFSLLEMMVTLVMMSVALSVLYEAISGATRNTRVAAQYIEANMLAESLLSDYARPIEREWTDAGQFGDFFWVAETLAAPALETSEAFTQAYDSPADGGVRLLRISVSWGEPGRERELQLMTIVPYRGVTP